MQEAAQGKKQKKIKKLKLSLHTSDSFPFQKPKASSVRSLKPISLLQESPPFSRKNKSRTLFKPQFQNSENIFRSASSCSEKKFLSQDAWMDWIGPGSYNDNIGNIGSKFNISTQSSSYKAWFPKSTRSDYKQNQSPGFGIYTPTISYTTPNQPKISFSMENRSKSSYFQKKIKQNISPGPAYCFNQPYDLICSQNEYHKGKFSKASQRPNKKIELVQIPSPNYYNIQKILSQKWNNKFISLRPRTSFNKIYDPKFVKNNLGKGPCPSSYSPKLINSLDGKLSKFQKQKRDIKMNFGVDLSIPGPGTYENHEQKVKTYSFSKARKGVNYRQRKYLFLVRNAHAFNRFYKVPNFTKL